MPKKKIITVDERLHVMDKKIDRLIDVVATRRDVAELDEKLSELEHHVERLVTATDGVVNMHETPYTEYAALKVQLSRYERWFGQLAKKTGVKLS